MKKTKSIKIIVSVVSVLFIAVLSGLAITGWQINWGPFAFLHSYDNEVSSISEKYDANENQGNIIFYGASNFRLWTDMEEDMKPYIVQNHGFGGSTDKDLAEYADTLLYPYNPNIVIFQTGSNDYVNLKGSDEEKVNACIEYKKQMFEEFHKNLPDAKFVVMSGLLLPGRSQYVNITQQVNEQLRELCDNKDYMYFVDASDMTYNGQSYNTELFRDDQIHLNHQGQLLWCNNYIKPALERIK
ncbi:MAG: GDSL-type esterase/lipase family protein [Eubacterium sp.]